MEIETNLIIQQQYDPSCSRDGTRQGVIKPNESRVGLLSAVTVTIRIGLSPMM